MLNQMEHKDDLTIVRPICWKECCDWILFKNEDAFYRNQHTIIGVNNFTSKLNNQNMNNKNAILNQYFKTFNDSCDYVLVKDEFAFNLSTNISQYIFLSTSESYNNYNSLHKIIQKDLNLSNDTTKYIFGSFSRDFISKFYPFLTDFSFIEIIFVRNTNTKDEIKYTEPPKCEQFIIWDECIQYINEKWFYKFWYKYDNTHKLQKIQQIVSSQINNNKININNYDISIFMLFENP
eukprot:263168_1